MSEETNESEKAVKKAVNRETPHIRSEKHVSVYSNFVQCAITPWDVRIDFGELGEVEDDITSVIDLASITVTPQLAKAVVGILHANLLSYEQQFGKINMPKGLRIPTLEPKQEDEKQSAPPENEQATGTSNKPQKK